MELLQEALVLSIRSGDRRCGSEAVLGLAAAAAGLGQDELSVKLDAIQRAVTADAGIVTDLLLLERLEHPVSAARLRLGARRVAALGAETDSPSLELALELLGAEAGNLERLRER